MSEKGRTEIGVPDGLIEISGPHADEISRRVSAALKAQEGHSKAATKLAGWIEHSHSERSLHVAIPVDFAEYLHAVLLGVASRNAQNVAPDKPATESVLGVPGLGATDRPPLTPAQISTIADRLMKLPKREVPPVLEMECEQHPGQRPIDCGCLRADGRIFLLTESQRMALCTILSEAMRSPDAAEVHIDCSQQPAVETTPGDLLKLFMLVTSNHDDVQDAAAGER